MNEVSPHLFPAPRTYFSDAAKSMTYKCGGGPGGYSIVEQYQQFSFPHLSRKHRNRAKIHWIIWHAPRTLEA